MSLFNNIYHGRKVLLTGHTGFKGSWLALWLQQLGAEVHGIGLAPDTRPNHWDLLKLDVADSRHDIRDAQGLATLVKNIAPEIVFHLAAQPLVRRSYRDPLETWSTNVMGSANLFEACRQTTSVRAIVAVTTDKCYENQGWAWGYRENDRLGGHDPYSASKAACELLAASYRNAFFGNNDMPLLATARAGNVIGGGDWSEDRLIPDLARAVVHGEQLLIRSPLATRPWQHVLESLSGYLMLGQHLLAGYEDIADAWNFGPDDEGNRSVNDVLLAMKKHWPALDWQLTDMPQPHEAGLLHLDSTKAKASLNWRPVWPLNIGLQHTAEWYREYAASRSVISHQQLAAYVSDAQNASVDWSLQ